MVTPTILRKEKENNWTLGKNYYFKSYHTETGVGTWSKLDYLFGSCVICLANCHWPRGPLKYISDTWSGKNSLPTNLSKSAVEYLEDLQNKLKTTQHYAVDHLKQEQSRHIQHYNLRARHKSFEPGDRCLILQPALHALRRWKGPATVVEKLSD